MEPPPMVLGTTGSPVSSVALLLLPVTVPLGPWSGWALAKLSLAGSARAGEGRKKNAASSRTGKSQIRNPKSEIRSKLKAWKGKIPNDPAQVNLPHLSLGVPGLLRISDFGFRISFMV